MLFNSISVTTLYFPFNKSITRQDFNFNRFDLYFIYKFVYLYLIHYKSQPYSSLTVTSRPLMLSHKRRLYLHPLYFMGQYFSSTLRLWLYSPSRRQSLEVFHILGFLRLRTFPAKHPLYKPLAPTFPIVTFPLYRHGLAFVSAQVISRFFPLSHHAVYPFGLLFGL